MVDKRIIAVSQAVIILMCIFGVYQYSIDQKEADSVGNLSVIDSNGVKHTFDQAPSRVVITNTYAGTVMRMLEIDFETVVGASGDFEDESIWPEFDDIPLVQLSAHSEIDFEALLDCYPEIYIVFASNGMVDTNAIREKLEPVGIKVIALDFYKYDTLRTEISVLAEIFGKEEKAQEIFDEFDEIESMVEQRILSVENLERPNVVMEHHASLTRDPVVLTGTSQWTDIIERAGGTNVFADLPGHTTHVDMEAIIDQNPDVLMFDGITFDIGYNDFDEEDRCETHMEFISERPGFNEINAVQNDNMLILAGEFAGPMMIHGLPHLAKYFHPDLFSDIDTEQYLDEYFLDYHETERVGKFVCQYNGG